jgi:hypothetical protein
VTRGHAAEEGDTYISDNGYEYTKQGGKFRPTHHIIAERKLGRPLKFNERVIFGENGKADLSPNNITVVRKGASATRARIAVVESRIEELQAELAILKSELEEDA